MDEKGQKP